MIKPERTHAVTGNRGQHQCQQKQAEQIVPQCRRDHGLADRCFEGVQVHEYPDGHRHRGYSQRYAQKQALRILERRLWQ